MLHKNTDLHRLALCAPPRAYSRPDRIGNPRFFTVRSRLADRYRSKKDFIETTFGRLEGVLRGGVKLEVQHLYVDGDTTVAELLSTSVTNEGAPFGPFRWRTGRLLCLGPVRAGRFARRGSAGAPGERTYLPQLGHVFLVFTACAKAIQAGH